MEGKKKSKKPILLKVGQKSKKDLIYKCSVCGKIESLIKGETASPCEICLKKKRYGKQYWVATSKEILILNKNVRRVVEGKKSLSDKISDAITDFCGSMYFIYLHMIWFLGWIFYNIYAPDPFDPYPFGMLTLVVSLEAIVLATFILISQNRQSEISEMRSELDYQIDLRSEKNSAEILDLLGKIYKAVKNK